MSQSGLSFYLRTGSPNLTGTLIGGRSAARSMEALPEGDEFVDDRVPVGLQVGKRNVIAKDELEIGKEIGSGAFSVVFKGKYKGNDVAIKRQRIESSKDLMKYSDAEIAILEGLNHTNVLKLFGVCYDDDYIYMVLELLKGGGMWYTGYSIAQINRLVDLHTVISKSEDEIPWLLRVRVAKDIVAVSQALLRFSQSLPHCVGHLLFA